MYNCLFLPLARCSCSGMACTELHSLRRQSVPSTDRGPSGWAPRVSRGVTSLIRSRRAIQQVPRDYELPPDACLSENLTGLKIVEVAPTAADGISGASSRLRRRPRALTKKLDSCSYVSPLRAHRSNFSASVGYGCATCSNSHVLRRPVSRRARIVPPARDNDVAAVAVVRARLLECNRSAALLS